MELQFFRSKRESYKHLIGRLFLCVGAPRAMLHDGAGSMLLHC